MKTVLKIEVLPNRNDFWFLAIGRRKTTRAVCWGPMDVHVYLPALLVDLEFFFIYYYYYLSEKNISNILG